MVTGVCAGNIALAYLMSKVHGQGVRVLIENAFPDIQKLLGIASYFMDIEGLKAKDVSDVKETNYKLREYFEGLEGQDNARAIIISIDNDNIDKCGEEICQIVNLARTRITHCQYNSPLKTGQHYDRFFYYPDLIEKVVKDLFQNEF